MKWKTFVGYFYFIVVKLPEPRKRMNENISLLILEKLFSDFSKDKKTFFLFFKEVLFCLPFTKKNFLENNFKEILHIGLWNLLLMDIFKVNFLSKVKLCYNQLGYNELGYNELCYNELGYNEHSMITNKLFS